MARYHAMGADGFGIYSEPADWITYELTHFQVAAFSWDCARPVEQFLHAYLDTRYGAAASDVLAYLDLVEAAGRALFDRPGGNYGDTAVVTGVREAFLHAQERLTEGRAKVAADSTPAFLLDRLIENLAYAIADTERAYYTALDDLPRAEESRRRVSALAEVQCFTGTVVRDTRVLRRSHGEAAVTRDVAEALYRRYREVW